MTVTVVLKQKKNDCCICAYASCEGIRWKVSRRRLRKYLSSRKTLGVESSLLRKYGLRGYTLLTSGSAKSLNKLLQFKKGLIFISFGDGYGHALFWDGVKCVDHQSGGRFNNNRTLSDMREDEYIDMVLIKNQCGLFTMALSYAWHLINQFRK